MYTFSKRSLDKLSACHEDIQKVMKDAIKESPFDFGITHGHRTPDEQKELYNKGRKYPGQIVTYKDGVKNKSKHNFLPSLACDIAIFVDGKLTWDIEYYKTVAEHILKIAEKKGIKITWGGNWNKFKDYPHFQI